MFFLFLGNMLIPSPIGLLDLTVENQAIQQLVFVEHTDIQNTELIPTSDLEEMVSRQLGEYFSGTRKVFDLPLNAIGTAFQQKIWQALGEIPYGNLLTYGEFSKKCGNIKAIRAVAAANGKNPIAIIIPCHRVIGQNGSLTGYAGGLWRKEFLLNLEQKNSIGFLFNSE